MDAEYDIEGAVFIRFALVGRPVLNGLAGKGQRRRRDALAAALFARDIVAALRRQIGFRRQGAHVDDAAVEEFLAAAIWEIPVEDFVALVGIDAGPRDQTKRAMSKALAERLTAEFEIVSDEQRHTGWH
ncbi:hypothetical protein GOD64_12495 [Sinorhizobium medicae]|nr:hypothetical protein [Sinorhizobium medicae]MDX0911071.1 hypothetical protein [Sinorhizobium medicae]